MMVVSKEVLVCAVHNMRDLGHSTEKAIEHIAERYALPVEVVHTLLIEDTDGCVEEEAV